MSRWFRGWGRTALAAALVAGVLVAHGATGARAAPNRYVAMSDGAQIAISIHYPVGYNPSLAYPTVFEMSGYDGGSAQGQTLLGDVEDALGADGTVPSNLLGFFLSEDSRQLTEMFSDDYVVVHASIRGTGCSSGAFDLYSWRTALDGYELVEWIAGQPWSNGDVAIMGHSYSGMTGFMVAATQPPHLRALTVSGLVDDVYRGILYPGGVANYVFPLVWSAAIRPAYDVLGGTAPGLVRGEQPGDAPNRREDCAENVRTRPVNPLNNPVVNGSSQYDGPWYRSTALISYLNGYIAANVHNPAVAAAAGKQNANYGISVPIHITGSWQDEQTGGRGFSHLWEKVAAGVPKRLLMSNGDHDTQNPRFSGDTVKNDRRAWIDHWMGLADNGYGTLAQGQTTTTVLLDKDGDQIGGRIDGQSFPLANTTWSPLYLRAGGQLLAQPAPGAEASDRYVAGSKRQSWFFPAGDDVGPPVTSADGPDEVTYRSAEMGADMAVVGPATANLWVDSTGQDTNEMFVEIIDEAPNGDRLYLQRGLLRASHQAFDPSRSDTFAGVTYRPWRYHDAAHEQRQVAGAEEYLIEIWPVGHVFRAGHRVVVKIHAPPVLDSYFGYVPRQLPVYTDTILHDAQHPSRVTLAVVPTPALAPPLACGEQEGVRCVEALP